MKTVQCEKGHFYDAEKYAECPHCLKNLEENKEPKSVTPPKPSESTMGHSSVLKEKDSEKDPKTGKKPKDEKNEKKDGILGRWIRKAGQKAPKDSPKTVSFYEDSDGSSSLSGVLSNNASDEQESTSEEKYSREEKKEEKPYKPEKNEPVSVDGDIKKAADYKKVSDVTVQFYSNSGSGEEPVVGWLVCVEGDAWGKSFELKTGKNRIGRSSQMDIVILGDQSVSRDTHAVVMFEPKHKDFIMSVNECGGMVYINDEILTSVVKLKLKDIIAIGNTKLLFVPLCDKTFDWDNPTVVGTNTVIETEQPSGINLNAAKQPRPDSVQAKRQQSESAAPGETWQCHTCGEFVPIGQEYCPLCGSEKPQ